MFEYNFNIPETLMFGMFVLLLGEKVRKKWSFFSTYCIPPAVIGGIIVSCFMTVGYQTESFVFTFDSTISSLLFVVFFTTVGFLANINMLLMGGRKAVIFLFVALLLVVLQNVFGIALAKMFDLHPLLGVAAGAVSLTGGPGTAVAFAPTFEAVGVDNGYVVSMSSATFGLIAGGVVGPPVARYLLIRHKIDPLKATNNVGVIQEDEDNIMTESSLFRAVFIILITMGVGSFFSKLWSDRIALPTQVGPMIIAAIIRNIFDHYKVKLPMKEITIIGSISLSIFLSIALMSIKLWELSSIALPLMIILFAQVGFVILYVSLVTFNTMGRDYDAAVISAGHCGFGLGATPNAMANMVTFTNMYGSSALSFLIVPLIGGFFIDIPASIIITIFINLYK